jgi:ABC-type dipeptide/oligopeptide/nickel transport system ATPase component
MVDSINANGSKTNTNISLLDVCNLVVTFQTPRGNVHAVNDMSFTVEPGEALGILGESGSGKSVSVGAIMGLLECPPAKIQGQIRYRDIDLLNADESIRRSVNGNRIAMVFQDAITSLNPGLSIGYQLIELFRVHRPETSKREARKQAIKLLDRVGIPSASERINSYPHEFSGGMNQRVMIALAIALEPD